FDRKHESAATSVTDVRILLQPGLEAREYRGTYGDGVLQAFAFEDVDGGQSGSDRDWIAAKRTGVRAGHPVHDIGPGHADAERHSGCDAFGDTNDVGLHAGVLNGPPFSGSASPRLHFIGDEQDGVPVADATDLLEEDVRCDDVPTFTLNRFQNYC